MSHTAHQLGSSLATGLTPHLPVEADQKTTARVSAFAAQMHIVRQQTARTETPPAAAVTPGIAKPPASNGKPTAPMNIVSFGKTARAEPEKHTEGPTGPARRSARSADQPANDVSPCAPMTAVPTTVAVTPNAQPMSHVTSSNVHRAVEQIGRDTSVNQLANGQFEFRLVMPTGSLAGAEIRVTTSGLNRVNLHIRRGRGRISADAVSDLVQRMGDSGVSVAGVDVE